MHKVDKQTRLIEEAKNIGYSICVNNYIHKMGNLYSFAIQIDENGDILEHKIFFNDPANVTIYVAENATKDLKRDLRWLKRRV